MVRAPREGEVVLIRIHVRDAARAAAFYQALFGWRLHAEGAAFETAGGLRGTFRRGEPSTAGPEIYVGTVDLDGAVRRAVRLGGVAIVRPGPGPDGSRIAQVLDPEGNRIGLWEAPAETLASGDLRVPR
jgi:predicted enzyme related to lactoylglutathione lyase